VYVQADERRHMDFDDILPTDLRRTRCVHENLLITVGQTKRFALS